MSNGDEDEEERRRKEEEDAPSPTDNAGEVGIGLDGHLTEGIGSGLGIDLKDGGLELQIAPGISTDI